jgi:hypothetical protein
MWDFAWPEYSLPQEFPSGTVRRESAPQNRPHAARWREAQMTESWWSMRKTMDEKDNGERQLRGGAVCPSSWASLFCAQKDPGEPREMTRALLHDGRGFR